MPPDFDATTCEDLGETTNDLMLFSTTEGTTWSWGPGYVGHWWILDVGGERVAVMNACDRTCTAKDLRTLRTMTESITFTPGSGWLRPAAGGSAGPPRVVPRVGDRR